MSGKYDFLKFDIIKHFGNHKSPTKIARLISDNYDAIDIENLRRHISRLKAENDLNDEIHPYLDGDANNVLIIGDLHTPFNLKEYLQLKLKTVLLEKTLSQVMTKLLLS